MCNNACLEWYPPTDIRPRKLQLTLLRNMVGKTKLGSIVSREDAVEAVDIKQLGIVMNGIRRQEVAASSSRRLRVDQY